MKRNKSIFSCFKAMTLMELLIVLIIVSIMIVTFYTLENFGHSQLIRAQRRTKVQNELSYAVEHMSKYIQQATGNINSNNLGLVVDASGEKLDVRVDFQQSPFDLSDDGWVSYELDKTNPARPVFKVDCTNAGSVVACPFGTGGGQTAEELSNRIISFVVAVNDSNSVDIDLTGRYNPDPAVEKDNYKNPEVNMKTQVICNSHSNH